MAIFQRLGRFLPRLARRCKSSEDSEDFLPSLTRSMHRLPKIQKTQKKFFRIFRRFASQLNWGSSPHGHAVFNKISTRSNSIQLRRNQFSFMKFNSNTDSMEKINEQYEERKILLILFNSAIGSCNYFWVRFF